MTDFVNDDVLDTIYNDETVIINGITLQTGDTVKFTATVSAERVKNGFRGKTGTFSGENIHVNELISIEKTD